MRNLGQGDHLGEKPMAITKLFCLVLGMLCVWHLGNTKLTFVVTGPQRREVGHPTPFPALEYFEAIETILPTLFIF